MAARTRASDPHSRGWLRTTRCAPSARRAEFLYTNMMAGGTTVLSGPGPGEIFGTMSEDQNDIPQQL